MNSKAKLRVVGPQAKPDKLAQFKLRQQQRHHAVYREGQINHCPNCGLTNWHLGRSSAECGNCGLPLPYGIR